jgi:hypothetical protein
VRHLYLCPISHLTTHINRFVGKYFTKLPAYLERAGRHLAPIFDRHVQKEAQDGKDSPGESVRASRYHTWPWNVFPLPQDLFFDMLLDAAPEKLRNLRDICLRILFTNFAAIHTTAMVIPILVITSIH